MRLPWPLSRRHPDPYEDFFLHAEAADPRNLIVNRLRGAPEGSVFAVKAETHTPAVMSQHVKEMGRFFGAERTHIAGTNVVVLQAAVPDDGTTSEAPDLPFAVLMLFQAEHDHRDNAGIGGQAAALAAAHATFQISAIIREFGYEATRLQLADPDRVAAQLGVGDLDARGRLRTPDLGTKLYIADLILTNLPLESD